MLDSHIRFCDKYFETLNGSESAIYAGFSKDTSRQQAWQLLQREDIQEYLVKMRAEMAEKSGITKAWVMERFKDISDRCMTAEPVMIKVDGQWVESGEYQFDSSGANKATESLGKIIGVFEKDNSQSAPVVNNIINLGEGEEPDAVTA